MADKYEDLKNLVAPLKQAGERVGLRINTDKTKIMSIAREHQDNNQPSINICGMDIEIVEDFKYLGRLPP